MTSTPCTRCGGSAVKLLKLDDRVIALCRDCTNKVSDILTHFVMREPVIRGYKAPARVLADYELAELDGQIYSNTLFF